MNGSSAKKSKPLRIGILTHNYPAYQKESKDAGKFVYAFSHELSKKSAVFVLCPDYNNKTEINDKLVPVSWFDWGSDGTKFGNWSYFSPFTYVNVLKLFRSGNRVVLEFVKRNKINYLLSFWNFPSGVFALHANEELNIPYSTWALGSDIYFYSKLPLVRQIISKVILRADKVFGNSIDICKAIKNLTGRSAKVLPTSNSVSVKDIKIPNLNKKLFNFLYLARLEKVKGPDLLIEAAKLLTEKKQNFEINIIGTGSMYEDLKRRISEYKLNNKVKLLGYIEDQSLVNGYLGESDCLVIPSRSESFPLVITEALQVGLPIIGSNVGDVGSFVGKNKIGMVFSSESSELLANCMEDMIIKGKRLRKTNQAKMLKLAKNFELKNIVDKFYNSTNV
ncbi:glycosyltransferase [Candidatus Woesebacteria bacterium]|nr:glycosyltransferase [Candidatus Woesebacteria bacterium]